MEPWACPGGSTITAIPTDKSLNFAQVLQDIFQQFPQAGSLVLDFSSVEKNLQKYLAMEKASFLKTSVTSKNLKREWAGLWPVKRGKDLLGYWGISGKKNGKELSLDERGLMDLLATHTAIILEAHAWGRELENASRQASLGFLTAALAHEVRNPLTAMGTLLQLLPRKKNDPNFMDSFQNLMLREIQHLTRLTENFLDFSKGTNSYWEKVDLDRIVRRVGWLLGPLFNSKRVQFKIVSTPGLHLKAVESQLESLLMNLLQNAFHSVGINGKVELSTRFLTVKGKGSQIEIRVGDNGKGITQENLKKIFKPYFSTKGDGTGLGLAICRKVIENHGGQWDVKSRVKSRKTVFKVLLPALPPPKE